MRPLPLRLIASPLIGPAGNREFLLHLRVGEDRAIADHPIAPEGWAERIDTVVGA